MVRVPGQKFVTESTYVMVNEPQASVAVATPVAFVAVLDGHSRVRFGGQVMTGALVSCTRIVCVQLELLPHESVAVQRRAMVIVPPQPVVVVSVYVIVKLPQASVAVAIPLALVLVSAGHGRVTLGGQVITGAVVSRTVMVCRQLELLLQRSVAVHVRAMTNVFPQFVVTTSLKVTMAAPQASTAVATPLALVLVLAGHWSVRLVGQVMTGGVMSRRVIVCTQLTVLPHSSVAVQVRTMTLLTPQPDVTSSE